MRARTQPVGMLLPVWREPKLDQEVLDRAEEGHVVEEARLLKRQHPLHALWCPIRPQLDGEATIPGGDGGLAAQPLPWRRGCG